MSDLMTTMPISTDLSSKSSINSNNNDNENDDPLKSFQIDLDRHRMREVLDKFQKILIPELKKDSSTIVWDLVPMICQRLRGLNEFRFKTFNVCRQILIELCEVCNPKELLIIFVSALEDYNYDSAYLDTTDSNCFKALLKPFELILLKLPKKRVETLKSVLSPLNQHIRRLSLSDLNSHKENVENDTNKVTSTKTSISPAVKNLYSVLSMYVDFLETFVYEVALADPNSQSYKTTKTFDPNIQRTILLKTLLMILDYPIQNLIKINEHENDSTSVITKKTNLFDEDLIPSAKSIAIKILHLISCLHSNFYTLFNRIDLITPDEDDNYPGLNLLPSSFKSSMAVLSYLLAIDSEVSPTNFTPRVYTHVHSFGIHLPYIQLLLTNDDSVVFQKGFKLLSIFLDLIKIETLEATFLDLIHQNHVVEALIQRMTFISDTNHHQIEALALYKRLVLAFEPVGRFEMLFLIMNQPEQHFGLNAVNVSIYKDLLFTHQVFQGSNLHRMVRTITKISNPVESRSSLEDKNDLIFNVLNFLRYLFKRDQKKQNTTRVWDILPVIQENFLKPLQEALELSRTNLKLELMGLKKRKIKLNEDNKKEKIEIEVEHKNIMFALQNFDIIESLFVRLKEIIDEQQ